MIVDANVATYWFVETPLSEASRQILRRADLVAPCVLRFEVARSLLKYVRARILPEEQARTAIRRVGTYFSELVDGDTFLLEAVELSIRHNHIVYDCLYLALALERREPLATADRRLAALAAKLGIETSLIQPA